METDYDWQLRIEAASTATWLDLGLGRAGHLLCPGGCEAVMRTRTANIWVYDDNGCDVVPPFLVGEVAGSLSVDEDRQQLRQFAESIIDWLERTERSGGAKIYRLP
jgi:hypothetical protein